MKKISKEQARQHNRAAKAINWWERNYRVVEMVKAILIAGFILIGVDHGVEYLISYLVNL